jgi:UDP-N-acetylglucosamine 4-epimerase
VYIDDVVDANILAIKTYNKNTYGQMFDIGFGKKITCEKLINKINQICDTDIKPIYKPERIGDIKYSCGDISKSFLLLNYYPKYNLTDGLKLFIAEFD